MSQHFVVCGLGHLGESVVRLLRGLGEPVVVVTAEVRRAKSVQLSDPDIRIVRGDARESRCLHAADIQNARAIIAATDSDLTNIEIALDAARISKTTPVVVRLFDQNLANIIERSLSVRKALAMSVIAAPVFAAAALDAPVFAWLNVNHIPCVIGAMPSTDLARKLPETLGRATASFSLGTKTLDSHHAVLTSEASWRKHLGAPTARKSTRRSVRNLVATLRSPLVMWKHAPLPIRVTFAILATLSAISVFIFAYGMNLRTLDAFYFLISTITTTGYGDITPRDAGAALKLYACFVMLLGSAATALFYSFFTDFIVAERFRSITQAPDVTATDHVIVVGLGSVGYRVVNALQRFGLRAVGIDVSSATPFASDLRAHTPVLTGDGRLPGVLAKAGVTRARALIAVTDNDAVNLEVVLAAKETNKSIRVVTRLFDPSFARKVQDTLPIEGALSASRVAAPMFVASAMYPGALAAFVYGNTFVMVTEELAPPSWDGLLAADVDAAHCVQLIPIDVGQAPRAIGNGERIEAGKRYIAIRQRQLQPID